jgi:hypothetical protein
MNTNIIIGLLIINISIFILVFGDKGVGGNGGLIVKFASIGKGKAKLVKWAVSVFLFILGTSLILNANIKYQELLFGVGLILWVGSACCLSLIGFRNSAWYRYQSVVSELSPLDIKIAKLSGLLFALGIIAFIVGVL